MVKKFVLKDFGYEVEIGKVARQADGAAWFKLGGTVILATACSAPSKEFPGFLPLTIDYREMFSAAGKIPGGYYKREGRSTEKEILIGRLIDRAIRPLFPANYFEQVQVLVTVYSVDKKHTPDTIALVASSIALSLSKISFLGPVGAVQVARVNGQWIYNPVYADIEASEVRIVVAGTEEGVTMVEGSMDNVSERELLDVLFVAHDKIKEQIVWQKSIQKELAVQKEVMPDPYNWQTWEQKSRSFVTEAMVANVYKEDKIERAAAVDAIKEQFSALHAAEIEEAAVPTKVIDYILSARLKHLVTEYIFKVNHRIDGRAFDKVRAISVETGLLPFTHGSALFTRGRTQALVSLTLGGGQDSQRTETIMDDTSEGGRFMVHYNFPPFSVGEVRPVRGAGRREVGHGSLARSAFLALLPDKENFPYTIRLVSDILESDGSSSMATVCGSTMAFLQGGVPIKQMVSGIAMGLLKSDNGDFRVLSDISGFEDDYGLMDFKVAGTKNSITAVQMDIKYKGGLSKEVLEKALVQSLIGRMHILGEMERVMSAPNQDLSPLVPRFVTFLVEKDKIGAIIGSGGKTIREIVEKTGCTIDIEDDGLVKIFGAPGPTMELAEKWVKTLAGQIESGMVFTGKVRRLAEFGLFVELVPGLDGLVHISKIPREKQLDIAKLYPIGSDLAVEVLEYDRETGRVRLGFANVK